MVCLVATFGIYSIVKNNVNIKTSTPNVEEKANIDVYGAEREEIADNILEIENEQNEIKEEIDIMKITALGEIMLGGNMDKSYALAFKEIASYTQNSDYTVASLATNITSVKDLSDTKSKYIANEEIVNAFSALNIKGINIATDHMLDFSKKMFLNTVDILKKNSIDVIGLENDIVYAEHGGIRVAFIGVNNVVIGNVSDYIDAGMYIYDLGKIKNSIKEVKTKADTVIVMTHYGKENSHTVTDVMSWFSKEIINAGADMVLGGHSLGIYPVEEYNGKLIVYSLGYLAHDTTNENGKKSAIFNIEVDKQGKIKKLEVLPTYIASKTEIKLYKEVNEEKNNQLLKELNKSRLNDYTSEIQNGKLVIKLK